VEETEGPVGADFSYSVSFQSYCNFYSHKC